MLLMEEFVSDTVPKSRHAAMKDVTTMQRKEEFVLGMEQRKRIAAVKDVPA